VLASGSGTNLQALIDTPGVRPHIRIVISDRPDSTALSRAAGAGIETAVVAWTDHESRESFCDALAAVIGDADIELTVLAGFMRILTPGFVNGQRGRIVNVHPSLLPAFPGMHAVAQALDHGLDKTGVTIHFVDEGVDTGPIIAQREVPILASDDEATLHARIQVEEHRLLPSVVADLIAQGAEARV
jgi:phosphoribosylglycinamide formyltransferase-1